MKTRWQYKVIVLDADADLSIVRLDSYGVNGWELVGVGGRYETQQYAYLKRPIGGWRPITGDLASADQQTKEVT